MSAKQQHHFCISLLLQRLLRICVQWDISFTRSYAMTCILWTGMSVPKTDCSLLEDAALVECVFVVFHEGILCSLAEGCETGREAGWAKWGVFWPDSTGLEHAGRWGVVGEGAENAGRGIYGMNQLLLFSLWPTIEQWPQQLIFT